MHYNILKLIIYWVYNHSGAIAYGGANFGQGTGVVYNVQCVGNETSLAQCTVVPAFECGHDQDAGVACPGRPIF